MWWIEAAVGVGAAAMKVEAATVESVSLATWG